MELASEPPQPDAFAAFLTAVDTSLGSIRDELSLPEAKPDSVPYNMAQIFTELPSLDSEVFSQVPVVLPAPVARSRGPSGRRRTMGAADWDLPPTNAEGRPLFGLPGDSPRPQPPPRPPSQPMGLVRILEGPAFCFAYDDQPPTLT